MSQNFEKENIFCFFTGVTSSHGYFIDYENRVFAFGDNSCTQLGIESEKTSIPREIKFFSINNIVITYIACGEGYSLFLSNKKNVYSCGANQNHQLGLLQNNMGNNMSDILENVQYPKKVDFKNGTVKIIRCGGFHSLLLTKNNEIFGFGDNSYSQLGIESLRNVKKPTKVCLPLKNAIIRDIRCGEFFSLFLTASGKVLSAGKCCDGALGIGKDRKEGNEIVFELSLKNIKQISVGYDFSLFLSEEGKVYGTGLNEYAELGLGHRNKVLKPEMISDETFSKYFVTRVICGGTHTFFVLKSGKILATGCNENYEIGLKKITVQKTPIVLDFLKDIVDIIAGARQSYFCSSTGEVYGCGYDSISIKPNEGYVFRGMKKRNFVEKGSTVKFSLLSLPCDLKIKKCGVQKDCYREKLFNNCNYYDCKIKLI